jgi:hypothetical protein
MSFAVFVWTTNRTAFHQSLILEPCLKLIRHVQLICSTCTWWPSDLNYFKLFIEQLPWTALRLMMLLSLYIFKSILLNNGQLRTDCIGWRAGHSFIAVVQGIPQTGLDCPGWIAWILCSPPMSMAACRGPPSCTGVLLPCCFPSSPWVPHLGKLSQGLLDLWI